MSNPRETLTVNTVSSRKHASVNSEIEESNDTKPCKCARENNNYNNNSNPTSSFTIINPQSPLNLTIPAIFLFLSLCFFLLLFTSPTPHRILAQFYTNLDRRLAAAVKPTKPTCDGGAWVYMYELPPEFNLGLLDDCRHLNMFRDMCPHVANRGLGQPRPGMPLGPNSSGWFATNQFTSEMIFHARVENHPCRTRDPARASLFYLPFYGGLHASSKFRESNLTARDALVTRLVEYLGEQPWWRRRHGHDHFLVLGRTAWDFMRAPAGDGPDYGASSLLALPRVQNISALIIERHPWRGRTQHGIPYPSYFHPSTFIEMQAWQDHVMTTRRPHLFSFIGAPRIGLRRAAVRNEVIRQCAESARCRLVQCGGENRCDEPEAVMRVMESSEFCLQPVGDTLTRRSTFDSVLAGCIPVFFSPNAAYTQYQWFFPADRNSYSAYIDLTGNFSRRKIEEELVKIPAERVKRMRRAVVEMIPAVTYAHPNATRFGFRDAVDIALAALASHVDSKFLKHNIPVV